MAAAELGGGWGGCSGAWAGVAEAPAVMRRVRAGENAVAGRSAGAYARGARERKVLSFTGTLSGLASAAGNSLTLSAGAAATGFFTATFSGVAYVNCYSTSGSTTLYYGEFNKHALNIENSPCATVTDCTFGNASESTNTTQRGIYATYGAGSGAGAHCLLIGPQRMANVKTAIEVDSVDSNCAIYLPWIQSGTGALSLPLNMHAISWT